MDKEILKLKIENLIALRTNLTNVVLVLSGGIVSLFFLPNSFVRNILIFIAGFYLLTIVSNLRNTVINIDKILNQRTDVYGKN